MGFAWWDKLNAKGLMTVARALSMSSRGAQRWKPCPSCHESRTGNDTRAPVGMSDEGWECFACGAKGDAADLLSYATLGCRLRDAKEQKLAVKQRAIELGLLDPPNDDYRPPSYTERIAHMAPSSYRPAGRLPPGVVFDDTPTDPGGPGNPMPEERIFASGLDWSPELPGAAAERLWKDPAAEPVLRYLTDARGFSERTIRHFGLGAHQDDAGGWWVTIPLFDHRGEPVNVKFRRLPNPDGKTVRPKYMACKGQPMVLYGAHQLTNDFSASVLVVEGELDVCAAFEYGYERTAVTGTAGAKQDWPDEWLDVLEPYHDFLIGSDQDKDGNAMSDKLGAKLGRERCSRVTLPYKDLGECLARGVLVDEIDRCMDRAVSLTGVQIVGIEEFEEAVVEGVENPESIIGLSTGSELLDGMFGGWPWGLTLITGESGDGKSTFLAWALMEQVRRGQHALFTAFENAPKMLAHKLVRQQLGGSSFDYPPEEVRAAMRQLAAMRRIHILKKYGSMDPKALVDTVKYSVRRHGVKVVGIDHAHFVVNEHDENYVGQLAYLSKELSTFGVENEVAILMIAHPKGDRVHKGDVSIRDVKGSKALEQACALGLSVKRPSRKEYREPAALICTDKQRGDWGSGSNSHAILWFDPDALVYADRRELLPGYARGSGADTSGSSPGGES